MTDITRFEIIDHRPCRQCAGTGRYQNDECANCEGLGASGRWVYTTPNDGAVVTYSIQDNGRTLKVFVEPKP